jgi:polyisoprenoid-binding protein YceI
VRTPQCETGRIALHTFSELHSTVLIGIVGPRPALLLFVGMPLMESRLTASQTWTVDVAHANIGFAVRHMMISNVRGTFTRVKSALQIPEGSTIPESIFAEIDVASVDTREGRRDSHLRSEDFFDVKKYPILTFVSTSIERTSERTFEVTGDLTVRGTTKAVTLPAQVEGQLTDRLGNRRIGYSGRFVIDRRDFGLSLNQPLESGGVLVGNEVDIELEAEVVLKG